LLSHSLLIFFFFTFKIFRENILFGLAFDPEKYEKAVVACLLLKDFMLLDNGDEEIIGEKGIELTPGQIQRICIARGVYRVLCGKAEMIFLDDPFSHLDVMSNFYYYYLFYFAFKIFYI